jgi:hypothetical protein
LCIPFGTFGKKAAIESMTRRRSQWTDWHRS